MSDPAPPPADPPPPGAATAAGRARWIGGLTALLLCVGVGGALVGAAPSIARALADDPAPDDPPTRPRPPHVVHLDGPAPPGAPRSVTSASDDNPRFAPDDEEPHLTELERMYPDGMWPGQHRPPPRGTAGPATNARPGHARTALTLRESSEPTAKVTGQVQAGAALSVVGEAGEWALVVLRAPDGAGLFGWTQRAAVSIP